MSRLDAFIRRLTAQRACLGLAAEMLTGTSGPVLEIGLGNGRTYDHLFLGDIHGTLPGIMDRIGQPAVLAHADIGSGDKTADTATGAFLGRVLSPLMASGGIMICDQDMALPESDVLALPEGINPGRYYMYRKSDG